MVISYVCTWLYKIHVLIFIKICRNRYKCAVIDFFVVAGRWLWRGGGLLLKFSVPNMPLTTSSVN